MEPGCWWLVSGGSVGSMVVVVDVPDLQCCCAVLFAGPGVGVEEFFGQDAVVALDFAVVAWCVWGDALVACAAQGGGEVVGAVAGSVVGDDAVDVLDAVAGEEGAGPVGEPDRGPGGFVG